MSKARAEQSNALSIIWLKQKRCLIPRQLGGTNTGTITWGDGENKSSIRYSVSINNQGTASEIDYIRLQYIYTSRSTGEKSNMDFKIPLVTTPCNYGGVRYWFICPLIKSKQYCGRRIGVVYSVGKWFGCRYCGEIAYNSQTKSGRFRGTTVCLPDIERAESEVKRYYYNNKPTRKYKRVIKLNEKLEISLMMLASRLGK